MKKHTHNPIVSIFTVILFSTFPSQAEKIYQYKFAPSAKTVENERKAQEEIKSSLRTSFTPFFAQRGNGSLQGVLVGLGSRFQTHFAWEAILGSALSTQRQENDSSMFLMGELTFSPFQTSFQSFDFGMGMNTLQVADGNFASFHGVLVERVNFGERWQARLDGRANLGFWILSAGGSLRW